MRKDIDIKNRIVNLHDVNTGIYEKVKQESFHDLNILYIKFDQGNAVISDQVSENYFKVK